MKKKTIAGIIAATMVLSLVGCSGSASNSTTISGAAQISLTLISLGGYQAHTVYFILSQSLNG